MMFTMLMSVTAEEKDNSLTVYIPHCNHVLYEP